MRGGITVWDATGKELLNLDDDDVGFWVVAFSPDLTRVAALSGPGDLPGRPMKLLVRIWEVATGRQLHSIEVAPATALAFSPDGTRLAAICVGRAGQSSQILVWDAATGRECARWEGPTGFAGNLAFSPDGRRIAAAVGDIRHRGELVVADLVS